MPVFPLQKAENGDLNWIIPDRFLAFCGPHSRTRLESGMCKCGASIVLFLKVPILHLLLKESRELS